MPQNRAIAETRAQRRSGSSDLIYAMGPDSTYIVSYSDGSLIDQFNTTSGSGGLCSDAKGNVFMPNGSHILKFAHGGTTPITTLDDGNYGADGCSVDPVTGNLAVANSEPYSRSGTGSIAVFSNASGNPTFYTDSRITHYFSCGYDVSGNLFFTATASGKPFVLAELPVGASRFNILHLNRNRKVLGPGSVQWDGATMSVGVDGARLIYRFRVSGSNANVVGTTKISKETPQDLNFWLQNGVFLTSGGAHNGSVGLWKYPRGGKVVARYKVVKKGQVGGITVSVGPTH